MISNSEFFKKLNEALDDYDEDNDPFMYGDVYHEPKPADTNPGFMNTTNRPGVRPLTKNDFVLDSDLECNCCSERPSYRDLKQKDFMGRPCDWCFRCVDGKCNH